MALASAIWRVVVAPEATIGTGPGKLPFADACSCTKSAPSANPCGVEVSTGVAGMRADQAACLRCRCSVMRNRLGVLSVDMLKQEAAACRMCEMSVPNGVTEENIQLALAHLDRIPTEVYVVDFLRIAPSTLVLEGYGQLSRPLLHDLR